MTSLVEIQTALTSNVKFQVTPIAMVSADYLAFTIQGVKRLYVDKGAEDTFLTEFNKTTNIISRDLSLTEIEYATICAELAFRNQIKNDINAIVGYSTNAISITGANSPYKNAEATILSLETRLSKLAFKFTHKSV